MNEAIRSVRASKLLQIGTLSINSDLEFPTYWTVSSLSTLGGWTFCQTILPDFVVWHTPPPFSNATQVLSPAYFVVETMSIFFRQLWWNDGLGRVYGSIEIKHSSWPVSTLLGQIQRIFIMIHAYFGSKRFDRWFLTLFLVTRRFHLWVWLS